jgi:hypothetical protein
MKALTITTIQHFQLEPTPTTRVLFSKLCKWRSAKLMPEESFYDNLDNGTQQAFF